MNDKFIRRAKRNDRAASWVITLGGLLVIFSVIFILMLIVKVALPLFEDPSIELYAKIALPTTESKVLAVGVDPYLETGFELRDDGILDFFDIQTGNPIDQLRLTAPVGDATIQAIEQTGRISYSILWSDGSATLDEVVFKPFYDEHDNNRRSIRHSLERQAEFPPDESGGATIIRSLVRESSEGRLTRIDQMADQRLRVSQIDVTENFLGEREEESFFEIIDGLTGKITALTLGKPGLELYAGTDSGHLLRWDLTEAGDAKLLDNKRAFPDSRSITSLRMVFGYVSLAVGDERGEVTIWQPVRETEVDNNKSLTLIHRLTAHDGPVVELLPSQRDKSIFSRSEKGILHLDHVTSERHLASFSNHRPLLTASLSIRGEGVIARNDEGRILVWKYKGEHPETSFATLFGKVWYEGYDQPEYVWQSSSGSDDFEPKLSMMPLIFGTFKGTFYAMLFAVPLALLGAIYTSQFARPRLRAVIKPMVEIMAAIPTVIIGFLAALWLAPIIERSLGAVFFSIILIPAALMIAILLWQPLRKREPLKQVERGYEFLAIGPVLLLGFAIAAVVGPLVEQWFFAGDLKQWMYDSWGTRYDPRNCIIIAFAMGFAVIPIIFTIAEDSLSNIPPSLKAASLALGASRWQTVRRVILPSASPGIFAGTMIGFGRAVGETMIVLMATGNTPIMDWSIFNGMRPLSANIAVEIPEAPVDGTLYRTLFLSAVILFMMTFIVNTVAEIVRQRLRKKYAQF